MWGLFGRKGRIADAAPTGWSSAPGVVVAAKQSRMSMATGSGDLGTARKFSVYRVVVRVEIPGNSVQVAGSLAIQGLIKEGQRTSVFYDPRGPARHWKLDRQATEEGFAEWCGTDAALASALELMPEAFRRELFPDQD